MRRVGFLVVLAAGCVDFGYAVDPPGDDDLMGDSFSPPGDDVGGCVEGAVTPSSTGPQVNIITLNVDTPVLVISAGETVTWTNADTQIHTVTAGAPGAITPPVLGGFDSGNLAPGSKWAWRFCDARTAVYFCQTHPQQMNGYQVVVQ